MFATTTTSALVAAVGAVSSPTLDATLPYVYVAIGLGVAFWVAKKLIGLVSHRSK